MKMVYKKISILKKKAEKRKERNKKDMRHIENKQQNGRHKSNKIKNHTNVTGLNNSIKSRLSD